LLLVVTFLVRFAVARQLLFNNESTSGVSLHSVAARNGVGGAGCARTEAGPRAARHRIHTDVRARTHPKWFRPPAPRQASGISVFCLIYQTEFYMKQFQVHAYERQKNDVWFAFVMAAMFAISVVGVVAGAFDAARDHAGADLAKARGQVIVMRDSAHEAVQAARAGARK
jgi:hypothetical protein